MHTASPVTHVNVPQSLPSSFRNSIWLGQTPTPEHRSDCFRIGCISKMSITTWASPLCQGSCDSISQSENNKLFVKGKKNKSRMFLCITRCMQSVRILKLGHSLRITALIKQPQNRKSENCAEQLRNAQPRLHSLWRQSRRAQEAWGVES